MVEQTIWAPDDGSGSAWQVAQAYTYDQVNRIATAAESKGGVQQWSRTYAYDHFGNRWLAGATGHTLHAATPTSSAQIEAATNRLASSTGAAYDAAGNMTSHPFITPGGGGMTYDANNKMTAFAATGVSVATKYDAEGRRVRKVHNGQTTVWVYDAFGKLAAEYTTAVSADTGVYYRTTDHLGSTRVVTDDTAAVKSRLDYFPFGEQLDTNRSGRGGVKDAGAATYNAGAGMRQKFTGKERDSETDLDEFGARMLVAALARFCSVDPGNAGARLSDPQRWNGYSYVINMPLTMVDPDGAAPCPADATSHCIDVIASTLDPYDGLTQMWLLSDFLSASGSGVDYWSLSSARDNGYSMLIPGVEAIRVAQSIRAGGTPNDCVGLTWFIEDWARQSTIITGGSMADFVGGFNALFDNSNSGHAALFDASAALQTNFGVGTVPIQGTAGANGFQTPAGQPQLGGWRPEFQDERDRRGDQAHHFAFFLMAGYNYGSHAGSVINTLVDIGPNQVGDRNLGLTTVAMGAALASGEMTMWQLGEAVRQLCQ